MFRIARRWIVRLGSGEVSSRSRSRTAFQVEALEGRTLLSYLAVQRDGHLIQIRAGDARHNAPLFSNGLGINPNPQFYRYYTGPQRPELNGVRSDTYVNGTKLYLSGTVKGPIIAKPTTAAQEATYVFAIDRGGSPKRGFFPGVPSIRYDALVTVSVTTKGVTGSLLLNDPISDLPGTTPVVLPTSTISIQGDVVRINLPLTMLPSTGRAINQWNVNFFTRNPSQQQNFHSIASFTPGHTQYQIYVSRPPGF